MEQNDPVDKNNYMDELTMKLLTNKTNYAKYLLKTDTCKYEERQQFIKDCSTFKDSILDMSRQMCDNNDVEYTSDVTHAFDNYARTLIRYLEVKQRSDELQQNFNNDDDDVMFPESINNVVDVKPKIKYNSTLDYFVSKK